MSSHVVTIRFPDGFVPTAKKNHQQPRFSRDGAFLGIQPGPKWRKQEPVIKQLIHEYINAYRVREVPEGNWFEAVVRYHVDKTLASKDRVVWEVWDLGPDTRPKSRRSRGLAQDATNIAAGLLDASEGLLYENDKRCKKLTVEIILEE